MAAMQNGGISPQMVWREYGHSFLPIIRLHESESKEHFDREIITERMRSIEARYDSHEISLDTYQNLKRGVQRLTEFHDTGKLEWTAPKKATRFVLNEYYEKILADCVPNEDVSRAC
jgi:hypothetical protein